MANEPPLRSSDQRFSKAPGQVKPLSQGIPTPKSLSSSLQTAFCSRALPQVPEHPPCHPSRDVAGAPDRYSRCPSPPPPAGCPVGDSPAGQVGERDDSRLWGRLQLPQGWADTGALHTAGGDTSPPHNSWQQGQRRSPSCRGRSPRWREGRRRQHRSCRLCRCSSCYCGEGGSSAASGSAPGASSGGAGNQRRPMRGHLHLQPLRVPPCSRLYSGCGTRPPAPRQEHDSARLRRALRHPQQRQPQAQPGRGWAALGSRDPGLHIHNARPGLGLSRALAAGRGPGAGGRRWGMFGRGWEGLWGGDSTWPPRALTPSFAKFLQLRSAGGSPSRGPLGRAGCGLERSLQTSPPPSRGWWWEGNGMREVPRPPSSAGSHPVSVTWPPALRFPNSTEPQRASTQTQQPNQSKRRRSVQKDKTEQAKNKEGLAPT
jgi:hypothetical protein